MAKLKKICFGVSLDNVNVVCPPVEPSNIIRLKNKKDMVLSIVALSFHVSTVLVSV